MDIVEKAKTFKAGPVPKYPTEDEERLALAILKKEITLSQAMHAIGVKTKGSMIGYVMFYRAVKLLYVKGIIKIEEGYA